MISKVFSYLFESMILRLTVRMPEQEGTRQGEHCHRRTTFLVHKKVHIGP